MLENSEITNANPNIGKSETGSKEKAKPRDRDWLTSKLAINEITTSSIDATTNETKH